jgi:hypothetical protein
MFNADACEEQNRIERYLGKKEQILAKYARKLWGNILKTSTLDPVATNCQTIRVND